MRLSHRWQAAALVAALAACSPSLNWREARLQGSGIAMLFPCRPDRHERAVRMADIELHAQMHSYHAAAASFSPVYLDAARPTQVGPLLAEWRERAASNIGGASAARPVAPPGATPNERSALPRIEGRLPGGQRVIEHAAFFVKVLRIYHATAIGESLPADAVETSFGAIKVAS